MKKIKSSWRNLIVLTIYIALLVLILHGADVSPRRILEISLEFILIFILIVPLSTLLHELGHMVFGLLTGYRFSALTILFWTLVKSDQGYSLKRYFLPGTLGRCLMIPPDYQDGHYPYQLYNAGGVIFNVLFGLAALALCFTVSDSTFLELFGIYSIFVGLLNGIPRKAGLVYNDGRNMQFVKSSATAKRAFWLGLAVTAKTTAGIRVKEMPEDWFIAPQPTDELNSITVVLLINRANRAFDRLDIAQAYEEYKSIPLDKVAPLLRQLVKADLIFCELLGDRNEATLALLKTEDFNQLLHKTRNMLTVIRMQYAYELLHNGDEQKAKECLAWFEKQAKNYPYKTEIVNERELYDLVDKRYEQIKKRLDPAMEQTGEVVQ